MREEREARMVAFRYKMRSIKSITDMCLARGEFNDLTGSGIAIFHCTFKYFPSIIIVFVRDFNTSPIGTSPYKSLLGDNSGRSAVGRKRRAKGSSYFGRFVLRFGQDAEVTVEILDRSHCLIEFNSKNRKIHKKQIRTEQESTLNAFKTCTRMCDPLKSFRPNVNSLALILYIFIYFALAAVRL